MLENSITAHFVILCCLPGSNTVSKQFLKFVLTDYAGLQLTLSTGSETPQLKENGNWRYFYMNINNETKNLKHHWHKTDLSEELSCAITGPDYVTVGVPSSVECEANCQPTCTFSMSLDGQEAQGHGNVLDFTVKSWVDTLTVTCTATDDETAASVTTKKQIQVLGKQNLC